MPSTAAAHSPAGQAMPSDPGTSSASDDSSPHNHTTRRPTSSSASDGEAEAVHVGTSNSGADPGTGAVSSPTSSDDSASGQ